MVKYINAVPLIEKLEASTINPTTAFINSVLIGMLEKAPAADVVEVVRCKDCEHKKEVPNCQKALYSSSCVACSFHSGLIMDGNDFCSYGKKKEGAE